MNTETYITAICLIAAATIIVISFRLAHWRNLAEHWRARHVAAEIAIAKIEATIAECEEAAQPIAYAADSPHGESIRERFDNSPLTFMGCHYVQNMDLHTLQAFLKAVADGVVERQLADYDKLNAALDAYDRPVRS